MKVISVKQPWANLIVKNIKPIENRTWPCPKKYIGERILIHASAKPINSQEANDALSDEMLDCIEKSLIKDLLNGYSLETDFSAIIGSVEIVDCVLNHESIWAQHKAIVQRKIKGEKVLVEVPVYNWVFSNIVLFDKPIENVKGKLSFWDYDLPEEYIQEIERKLKAATQDLEECISCDKKFLFEIMERDSNGNWFCPECWKELAPVMQAEYEESLKITTENLLEKLEDIDAWVVYLLAEKALVCYNTELEDEDGSVSTAKAASCLNDMGLNSWQDVIIKYHNEIGYSQEILDTVKID